MSFQWQFDAPTGVFKNHKLSAQLREASIAESKFMQFVRPEPGYGKRNGESVTITRVSNISVPTSSALTENVRIAEDSITLSTQAITVAENGRAVPFTSFAQDLSHIDLRNAVQRQLKNQMKLSLDISSAAAFKAGQEKAIPDGIASIVFDNDGTPSTSATVSLNMFHVEQIRDRLFTTLNVEPAAGDDYIGIIATKSKRSLMSDPAWVDWKKYTDPDAKFNGEIGRIENIRFIESNHTSALSNSQGTGSVLGEGVFFGADAVVMAVAEDPEMRAKMAEDYGRSNGVAWYGIYAFGQIWSDSNNAGEARVVHLTSS
jgi:N4-gp56 family major capsid protein